MDATEGRGAVADTELTLFPGSEANEIFSNTVWSIVLDGLERNGVNPYENLNPETACKVSE